MKYLLYVGIVMVASNAQGLVVYNQTISSPDFRHNGLIPIQFTCDGKNQMPIIQWSGLNPKISKELALVCEDPDAPTPEPFVHWVMYNIPSTVTQINPEIGRVPTLADGSKQGTNSFGKIGYDGPCPPKGNKPHHYIFTLYVLDKPITLKQGATKQELMKAINEQSNIAQSLQLIGIYQRKK